MLVFLLLLVEFVAPPPPPPPPRASSRFLLVVDVCAVSVCNGRGIRSVPTKQTTVLFDNDVEEERIEEDKGVSQV